MIPLVKKRFLETVHGDGPATELLTNEEKNNNTPLQKKRKEKKKTRPKTKQNKNPEQNGEKSDPKYKI